MGWGMWGSLEKVRPGQEAGLESYFPDVNIPKQDPGAQVCPGLRASKEPSIRS